MSYDPNDPNLGDDALAAGMDPMLGTEPAETIDQRINYALDMIAGGPANWKPDVTLPASKIGDGTVPIANGGTAAATAAGARTNLDVFAKGETYNRGTIDAAFSARDATIASKLPLAGGTVTGDLGVAGNLYVGTHPPATSGYVVAYINGDNRIAGGASSQRFKHDIVRDPELPDLFVVPLAEFVMDGDETETRRFGYIAEDLADSPLKRFVVYEENGAPYSYDMIALLLAQVAQLHARVAELEARDAVA